MKTYIFFFSIIINLPCFCQLDVKKEAVDFNSESFFNLKNDIVKNEIKCFLQIVKDSAKNLNSCDQLLYSIPAVRGTESSVTFEEGNLSSLKLLIEIIIGDVDTTKNKFEIINNENPKGILSNHKICFGVSEKYPKKEMKGIRLIRYKGKMNIPDSALENIYEPNLYFKNSKKISCAVYRSKDYKRVYINMLNGEAENKYEVTWVIERGKCFRVIDRIH